MSEQKPHHSRLRKPPLKRMVCQLRFPPELGFNATVVRPLQKALSDDYPDVEQQDALAVATMRSGAKLPEIEVKPVFIFKAPGGETSIHISEASIAWVTTKYNRFGDFAELWQRLMAVATKELQLRRQLRLGLRYSNVIEGGHHDSVGSWGSLIKDHLLTASVKVESLLPAETFVSQNAVRFRTAYGTYLFKYGFPVPPEESLPQGYLLDIDAYDEEPKPIDVDEQLNRLTSWNHEIFRLLRHSVSDNLWASFDPEELG